jgi:hypothetical protein
MGGETKVMRVMGKGAGCAMCDKGRARWCSSGGLAVRKGALRRRGFERLSVCALCVMRGDCQKLKLGL